MLRDRAVVYPPTGAAATVRKVKKPPGGQGQGREKSGVRMQSDSTQRMTSHSLFRLNMRTFHYQHHIQHEPPNKPTSAPRAHRRGTVSMARARKQNEHCRVDDDDDMAVIWYWP